MQKTKNKPFVLTVFGASGDLAKLKIFPSIYNLARRGKLPKDFHIVGFARTKKSQKQFQSEFARSIKKAYGKELNQKVLDKLVKKVTYFTGQYSQRDSFKEFGKFLNKLTNDKKYLKIFYFSVPPIAFGPIVQNLGETKLKDKTKFRLIIEKPFGNDLKSAEKLFHHISNYFNEEQIYLLDHYLGKSAVQSLLHLRHSNRILNAMLKGREVANIQITAFEDFGVKDRVGYFDQVGIIKDMIQSHLLQILALITMSIPVTYRATSIQQEKYNILSALTLPKYASNIVLGQYQSYTKDREVKRGSKTETFAALRMHIDRESWHNIPIYIRTGKMVNEKHTIVVVELKKFDFQTSEEDPNRLIFELQPDERLHIKLLNKHSGGNMYQDVMTSSSIACEGESCAPEHARLLEDVFEGDKRYFLSFPEIIACWRLIDKVCGKLEDNPQKLNIYKDKSGGPKVQHELTRIDGFQWFNIHDL